MRFNYSSKRDLYYEKAMKLYFEEGMCGTHICKVLPISRAILYKWIAIFMYLTDYRERCLKDVITQLEPGLFKKVTGLSVADFNMLCTLGVFNAPLMNDAIFKFKRYEDASLVYTGIDKHKGEEVGGWDTSLRREEYEKLFFNQQASMATPTYGTYIVEDNDKEGSELQDNKVEYKNVSTPVASQPTKKPVVSGYMPYEKKPLQKTKSEAEKLFDNVGEGTVVTHKKFGIGQITKIDRKAQYVFVAFKDGGEKKFLFPGAFTSGFLSL